MLQETARITLSSPEQTAALAVRLGARLKPGDTVLLEGSIGAGKTHFARSLIQPCSARGYSLADLHTRADLRRGWGRDLAR